MPKMDDEEKHDASMKEDDKAVSMMTVEPVSDFQDRYY